MGKGYDRDRYCSIRYGRVRLLTLTCGLLLLIINPLVIYFTGITFVQGWYQSFGIGNLWFVSPLEGVESILISRSLYLPSLIGMLIPLVVAFLLGRVFCSWICPINLFGEVLDRIRRFIGRRKHIRDRMVLTRRLLWYALVGELLLSMSLGAPLFVFLSPPGLVGRELMMAVFFHKLAFEGIVILIVLALELLTRRMYCRYFCPLGGLLALVGIRRKMRIVRSHETCTGCGRCDLVCPMGIKPSLDQALTAYCWNCGDCIDSCDDDALEFVWHESSGRFNE